MSTPNNTPPNEASRNINISLETDGSLNYTISNSLTLAEVIGSFVIVAAGLLNRNSPTVEMLNAIFDKVAQIPIADQPAEQFTMPQHYGHLHTYQPEDMLPATDELSPHDHLRHNPLVSMFDKFQHNNG